MNDHLHFLHLIAGRELGGLDAAESAELGEHLAGCEACTSESRLIADAAAQIVFAAPVRQPPAGMRSSILAAIHAEAKGPDAAGATIPARPNVPAAPAAEGWRTRLMGPRFRLAGVGLAAVLVVAALGLGAWNLKLRSQLDAQSQALAAAEQRVAVQDAAMVVALDPRHVAANLDPQSVAPAAIAQAVYLPGTNQAYLIADRLPATPAAHVYQLWYADGSGVHPLGTYAFNGEGSFIAPFGVDLGGKAAAMVTLEATGGATTGPGPEVVFGQLPSH